MLSQHVSSTLILSIPLVSLTGDVSDLYLTRPPPNAPHKTVRPEKIIIAGNYAGAGLCIALLIVLRDLNLPGLCSFPLVPICHVERYVGKLYATVPVGSRLTVLSAGYHTTLWLHPRTFRDLANP